MLEIWRKVVSPTHSARRSRVIQPNSIDNNIDEMRAFRKGRIERAIGERGSGAWSARRRQREDQPTMWPRSVGQLVFLDDALIPLEFALDAVLELAVALGKMSNDRIVADRDIRPEQRPGHSYGVAKREPVSRKKRMSIFSHDGPFADVIHWLPQCVQRHVCSRSCVPE